MNNNTNKTNYNSNNMNYYKSMPISLEEARDWYKGDNDILKTLAIKAFGEKALMSSIKSFKNIKSFKDACNILNINYNDANYVVSCVNKISKASAAMFKLNVIKMALNLRQDLHLTKDSNTSSIYYPCNPFVIKKSIYYNKTFNLGKFERIGRIKNEGKIYQVVNAEPYCSDYAGLSNYQSDYNRSNTFCGTAFLGCATKEIAEHFGKYFGMLITEAKYGDLSDFEIIDSKYNI